MTTREFDGFRAIVTGGASGIGMATARILADRGASVSVLDLQIDHVTAGLHGITCNVADRGSVTQAVTDAAEHLGGIDIVVNNARIGAQGTVADNDDDEWRRVFDVNVIGMARISAAALPWLRQSSAAAW